MSESTHRPHLIESVPVSLQKLLIREAAVALSRRRLIQAIPIAQAHEKEVRATRAPFMIILPTKANQEIRANLEESRQTLDDLQKNLAKLDSVESRLLPLVAYRLETHLRASSKDYVNGLAGNRSPGDWVRVQSRLADCIRIYHAALATLAERCVSLAPGKTIGSDPSCQRLVIRAITWGERLEGEVHFINKIADAQRALNGPGGFTLKRQPAVNWKESAQSLLAFDGEAGAKAVRNLIPQSEAITRQIILEIAAEQQLTLRNSEQDTAQHHAAHWAALREAALLKVNPAGRETLTMETAVLLESGELETWALLDDPAPAPAAPPPPASKPPFAVTSAPFPKPVPPPSRAPELKLPSRTQPPFIPPKP